MFQVCTPEKARAEAAAAGKFTDTEAKALAKQVGMTAAEWNLRSLKAADAAKAYDQGTPGAG